MSDEDNYDLPSRVDTTKEKDEIYKYDDPLKPDEFEATPSSFKRGKRRAALIASQSIKKNCFQFRCHDADGNVTVNRQTRSLSSPERRGDVSHRQDDPMEYLFNAVASSSPLKSPQAAKKLHTSTASLCTHIETASPSNSFARALKQLGTNEGKCEKTKNQDGWNRDHGRRHIASSVATNPELKSRTSKSRAKWAFSPSRGATNPDLKPRTRRSSPQESPFAFTSPTAVATPELNLTTRKSMASETDERASSPSSFATTPELNSTSRRPSPQEASGGFSPSSFATTPELNSTSRRPLPQEASGGFSPSSFATTPDLNSNSRRPLYQEPSLGFSPPSSAATSDLNSSSRRPMPREAPHAFSPSSVAATPDLNSIARTSSAAAIPDPASTFPSSIGLPQTDMEMDFDYPPAQAVPTGIEPTLFQLRSDFARLMSLCDIKHLLSPGSTEVVDLQAIFDADSVVVLLHSLTDIAKFHSLVSLELKPALPTSKPTHVRICVKNRSDGFCPCTPDGSLPKRWIRLDQFPCFNVGTADFKGGLKAYISVHVLDNTNTIGRNCRPETTKTWNFVFNLAKNRYRETKVSSAAGHQEGKKQWSDYCGNIPPFQAIGDVRRRDTGACLNGMPVISFVLSVMNEILLRIADGTWHDCPEGVDQKAAQKLVDKSIIVIQKAGFKSYWKTMQDSMDVSQFDDFPDPPKLQRNEASIQMYHEYLQNCIAETYRRAFIFFFGLPPESGDEEEEEEEEDDDELSSSDSHRSSNSEENGNESLNSNQELGLEIPAQGAHRINRSNYTYPTAYIDIAVVLYSSHDSINIFPNFRSEKCVVEASKARRDQIKMPRRSCFDVNKKQTQHINTSTTEPTSPSGNTSILNIVSDDEEEDDGEPPEIDGPFLFEELNQLNVTNPTIEVEESNEEDCPEDRDLGQQEEEKDTDLRIFFKMLQDTFEERKVNRVRYCLWGTCKPVANAQNKPGCKQEVTTHFLQDENFRPTIEGLVGLSPFRGRFRRCTPIVQMYEPSTRAGLLKQDRRNILRRSRTIPYMIARMFSELETILSKATEDLVLEQKVGVFRRIRDSFDILDSWLDHFQNQQTKVRYEFTFVHYFGDGDYTAPVVPISNDMSPLSCISYAPRKELSNHMKNHVEWLRAGLMDGFCQIERFPMMLKHISPQTWAMYVTLAEMVNAILGCSGGTVDSVLYSGIQEARTQAFNNSEVYFGPAANLAINNHRNRYYYFQDHMWSPHPNSIVFPPPNEGNGFRTGTRFGVDPSILTNYGLKLQNLPLIPSPHPQEDMQKCLRYLAEKVPISQIENLRKLQHPAQFRRSATLLYSAFLKAGDPNLSTNENFDPFRKMQVDTIASDPDTMEKLLKEIAVIIVSHAHFEWSHRIAKGYEKHPNLTKASFKMKDMESELQSSSTIHAIRETFANHLNFDRKDPPLDQRKTLESAAKIFATLTGCKNGAMKMEPNTNQGWRNSGVPRLLLVLQCICKDIPPRLTPIRESYGGRDPLNFENPFDGMVLHHFVAADVQSKQQHPSDFPVLWHAPPAKLVYEIDTTKCVRIKYDSVNCRATLRMKNDSLPLTNPDNIVRDNFVRNFTTIDKGSCWFKEMSPHLKQDLHSTLSREDRDCLACTMRKDHPTSITKIIAFQAYLVHFLKHCRGHDAPTDSDTIDMLTNSFLSHMYPNSTRRNEFQKFIKRVSVGNSIKNRTTEEMSFPQLKSISSTWLSAKNTNPDSLYNLSTTMLKDPSEIANPSNIEEAWKPPEELTPLHRKLYDKQVSLMTERLTRANLTKATIIASYFGILSTEYLNGIKNIRSQLRSKITHYHNAKTDTHKKAALEACLSFARDFNVSGGSNHLSTQFDFNPKP